MGKRESEWRRKRGIKKGVVGIVTRETEREKKTKIGKTSKK